jgi:flagellar hook-basal body complex protein FliE
VSNAIFPGLPQSFPGALPTAPTPSTGPDAEGSSFGSTLKDAINKVNDLGSTSDQQVSELVEGDRQDIHNVMIAVEKADIAFQLMMQVRNKIVNAYQEVSKMQF